MNARAQTSPAARIALAVVAEPERAAPAPAGAREDALRDLLQTGADAGVSLVATRPDGDVERRLGQAWPFPSPFQVTVRTVALSEGLDRIEARARRSLERLGLPRGDVLLVSGAADLAGSEGRALWDRINSLKDQGLYRRIGFCATVADDPAMLARRLRPDVVQVDCNVLDQRAVTDGTLAALADADVAIHLASVFAHGLLFSGDEAGVTAPADWARDLSRVRRRLAEARLDPMQAALAFALAQPVAAVVASVASAAELRAVLAAAHAPTPTVDWSQLALPAATARAAAALSLVSSAA